MKSPINYFFAFILSIGFFLVFGFGVGRYLSDEVSLTYTAPEDWATIYWMFTSGGTLVSCGLILLWLRGTSNTGRNLRTAESLWNTLFAVSWSAAVALFALMFFWFRKEGIELIYHLLMFLAVLVILPVYFWLTSRFFTRSPYDRAVLFNR